MQLYTQHSNGDFLMQTQIDFDNFFETEAEDITLLWLKNWRWNVIFNWHHLHIDRRSERSRRIAAKAFPNGISQADFMKVEITEAS